jgi:transcriptional regulator with XRE-family HTH domain
MIKIEIAPVVPAQIRAARSLLGWSQEGLAEKANVSLSTVRDYENERRGAVSSGAKSICLALESHGVAFLSSEGNSGPGVRLVTNKPNILRGPVWDSKADSLKTFVEWAGQQIEMFVSQEALEDIGKFENTRSEAEYIALFNRHRDLILEVAVRAINAKRVTPDHRLHLKTEDF